MNIIQKQISTLPALSTLRFPQRHIKLEQRTNNKFSDKKMDHPTNKFATSTSTSASRHIHNTQIN